MNSLATQTRMPLWIRQQLGVDRHFGATREAISAQKLNTVCVEAKCPNRGECWSRGTATFMLLGAICTRACGFCAVATGKPKGVEEDEPQRVVEAVAALQLKYVVLTSVNRDDLKDGGAAIFARTVAALRLRSPLLGVELLTPDFRNCQESAWQTINQTLNELPAPARKDLVWGHNVEMVPRLYKTARRGANYQRSLKLLAGAALLPNVKTKSALMLGLGEEQNEVIDVLRDLRAHGVERISLGQYLRPTLKHLPVQRYIPPEEFLAYENLARSMGFAWVKAGPLVRSSYFAETVC